MWDILYETDYIYIPWAMQSVTATMHWCCDLCQLALGNRMYTPTVR